MMNRLEKLMALEKLTDELCGELEAILAEESPKFTDDGVRQLERVFAAQARVLCVGLEARDFQGAKDQADDLEAADWGHAALPFAN